MAIEHTFRQPDNWHIHPRQGEMLKLVCHHFSIYGRALCMGNTSPLIEIAEQAFDFREEIFQAGAEFDPQMCIMLTENTTPAIIYKAAEAGIKFVKFIPAATSTGAKTRGLRLFDFDKLRPLLEAVKEADSFFIVHAELISTKRGIKIHPFLREEAAIPYIKRYLEMVPGLKMTIAHNSTRKMINFIKRLENPQMAGELAPQHAIFTYDMVFGENDWPPDYLENFCLPVAKMEEDRQAVRETMVSGDERFFYATDAAPHWWEDKVEQFKPGVFFGEKEYPLTFQIFEEMGASRKAFEDFTSRFGAEHYGFPLNEGMITLKKESWTSPASIFSRNVSFGDKGKELRFCLGDQKLGWQISVIDGV